MQAKLTVGKPGDPYEQEADRVAAQVMSMPEPAGYLLEEGALGEGEKGKGEGSDLSPLPLALSPLSDSEEELQTKPLAATITPLVQREEMPEEEEVQTKGLANTLQREAMPEEEEALQTKASPTPDSRLPTPSLQREAVLEEEEVQTKPLANTVQRQEMPEEEEAVQTKPSLQRATDGSLQAGGNLESRLNSSKGGGSPLPQDVKGFMESRFRTDFSQVRVHTDSEAVQMNRDLNAQAFTHKQDVYFGAGKAPGKDALTAHELTHVVQQARAVQVKQVSNQLPIQQKCSNCEKESEIQKSINANPVSSATSGDPSIGQSRTDSAADLNTPCKPYPDPELAKANWGRLRTLIPSLTETYTQCSKVRPVWETYFAATSEEFNFKAPDCVAEAAKVDKSAIEDTYNAIDGKILTAIRFNLPIILQGFTGTSIELPLEEAIGPSSIVLVHVDILYNDPFNAAANIAGGTGRRGEGSDLFGDDDRVLSGPVIINVDTVDSAKGMSGRIYWEPHVHVKDTVDFCPGNLGNFFQKKLTIPMSKLENMGLTRDVPITIDYDLPVRQNNFRNVKPLFGPLLPENPPGSKPSQFRSQRFAGQPTLEACGRGEYRMLVGEKDAEAVQKVQETLNEAGIPIQANGIYSEETRLAVAKFKKEHDPQIIPSDGVVGPQTSHALDEIAVKNDGSTNS
ncbi:MAG: DUF4157 domain-containing protein [Leptolyngbyaceae cyanobacterium bins.302]|nr:DUF4157 domain-containing protein [Leptolyngbyaceae cyanobacterium bins.302]